MSGINVKMVGDLPVNVIDDIAQWFDLFNKLDWITLASLFSRILDTLQGYHHSTYGKFVSSCSPKELIFLMKYTEDRENISKIKERILKGIDVGKK